MALLGRVGSGKSTILKAAVRLLDTPPNTVFLDGHDVCDFPVLRLRELVTLVPQDPFLFSAMLRENLTYDDPRTPRRAHLVRSGRRRAVTHGEGRTYLTAWPPS